jgi:crotonobetainyl-CoA:carnitine CoA-transferase CaiB-like acyl-CoA transferase
VNALEGLRVLDLSRLLPGPYATLLLADLGADVVKVEDPGAGDALRFLPPLLGEQSGAFHALNRNKRSLGLDLRRPEGVAVFLRLARPADVVVESFRPGVLDRMGLGWQVLRDANPRLVLCSLTGYGQDGPYAARAGHDLDYQAFSGVLGATGPPERPILPGVQLADLAGGSWPAVTGILAALLRRDRTGEGAHLDVSMVEGALALTTLSQAMAAARGTPVARGREMLSGGTACYGVYRTRDGRFAALAALEPKFFAGFCAAVGRPELAERQFDGEGPRAELTEIFLGRTLVEWERFAAEHDVCVAPVREGDEPRHDPHLAARGAFVSVETPWDGRAVQGIATPVRMTGSARPLRPAPRLGEHGDAVLAEAGFSGAEIAELRAAGVVGP